MQAIVIFLLLSIPFSWILAAESLSVVINEIAWAGTEVSPHDEWIELYNNSSFPVGLKGWKLIAEDETPKINLEGEIPSRGFFLLERTNDETVPGIEADLIYKGSLKNSGEYLKLIDNEGKIIDEVNCFSGWFAGANETKQTMERKNTTVSGSEAKNWQTSQNSGGTPKAENILLEMEQKLSAQSPEENGAGPLACGTCGEKLIVYPKNIFINEILPSPEGPDAENEWIEVSNGNNFEVDVSGWQIRDRVGATRTFTIPQRTKIEANGFLVLLRAVTEITLQNSGDGLELLNPNKEVVHKVNYERALLGQSFNRTSSSDWRWSNILTPGKENIITQTEILKTKPPETSNKKDGQVESSSSENQPKENKKTLAKISGELPKSSYPLITFLIAFVIAIFSAIIVLILKKKIEV